MLTKLNKDEINKLSENKEKVNHLSGKIWFLLLIIIFILVILLGRANVGKTSLINT